MGIETKTEDKPKYNCPKDTTFRMKDGIMQKTIPMIKRYLWKTNV